MSNDTDSADDERSLFAKILRRSADELEAPNDDGTDPDVEQREGDEPDDDGEMDEAEQAADPIDTALAEGAIEAGQASRLRDVAGRMDDGGVQTLVDAISENDLDVDEAVELIESVNAADDEPMDNEPEELRADPADDEPADADLDAVSDEEIGELRSRLLGDLSERLDDIEQRLSDLADEVEDTVDEDALEQRLGSLGETLDEEFEDLIQRADVVGSPHPKTGETSDTPLSDSLDQLRGES